MNRFSPFSKLTARALLARLGLLALLLAVVTVSVLAARPQETQTTISDTALEQIAAIEQMKQTFTPEEQKLSTNLVIASRLARHVPVPAFVEAIFRGSVRDGKGRHHVDIHVTGGGSVADEITKGGGEITVDRRQGHHIRGFVRPDQLLKLAADPTVGWIREADEAVTNIGSVTSQGYISHAANQVVAQGVTGAGVKVGVLSDSATATRVAALIATGDLPSDTVVLPGQASTGTDEGTAMMEIVHDLAPGAQLFFATGNGGQPTFAANIRALRFQYGCDIIVDDLSYYAEAAFQDGTVAKAVNDVVADGALYFSSAANSGNLTLGTSGTWEGDFKQGAAVTATMYSNLGESGYFHDFGTGLYYDKLTAASSYVTLKWSDPLGASTNDYDLFVVKADGSSVLKYSAGSQSGTQDPYEGTSLTTSQGAVGNLIVVVKYSGDARALRVDTHRGRLAVATAGSTFGHNGGQSTITVAATYWNSAKTGTKAFVGATNPIETFSSDGPRKIFYQPDGTPITPGNVLFATSGGTTLVKPDITAADGVFTKTPSFLPFFGTSAAAPHAAAVAALVKSANPSLTNVQIKNILYSTALDNMAPGVDRDSGYGIVMAQRAVQAARQ